MPVPASVKYIPKKSQAGLVEYQKQALTFFGRNNEIRDRMEAIDRRYMRESDMTQAHRRAKLLNKVGDATRYQNIEVPVVYPQVEEAVTYQTSVFLTGYPIFGVVANPENQDAALQMEAIIEENSIRGGWVRQFMMFFRDGFKYNLSAVEADWCQEAVPALDTDISVNATQGVQKEIIWAGNKIRRIDMYNAAWDTRVPFTELATRGEFFSYNIPMSRIELRMFLNSLPAPLVGAQKDAFDAPDFQVMGAINSPFGYYVPAINPEVSLSFADPNNIPWDTWISMSGGRRTRNYRPNYVVTVLYARIIPSEFDLKVSQENTPQVWKLIYVNHSILVSATRMTNAHGLIPVFMGCPQEDGLGPQTKSFAENLEGYQSVASALVNSAISARRRAISDRALYDPSRVAERHINNDSPSAKIPVRPSAYGKPVSEAVYQFPFRDENSGVAFQETRTVMEFADLTSGQNRARRGQFQKGNKTLREYEDTMGNSNARDQMCAIGYEAQVFTPLKEVLKLNILQYQGVVDIFSQSRGMNIAIDPVKLRQAVLAFKITDGLLPSAKVINEDVLQVAFQTLQAVPSLGAAYRVAPMFSYMMKSQNCDLKPFEKPQEQVAFEQALGAWNQAAQLAAQKGAVFNSPQPTPQQFGWNPAATNPQAVPTTTGQAQ